MEGWRRERASLFLLWVQYDILFLQRIVGKVIVGRGLMSTPPRQKVGDFRLHGIRMKESAHSDARIVKNHPGFT